MGWFLVKPSGSKTSKTGKGRSKRKKGKSKKNQWDPEKVWLMAKLSLALVLLVAGGVGWFYAEKHLVAYVAQVRAAEAETEDVQLVEAPQWMSDGLQLELRGLVADSLDENPMSGESLQVAEQQLADSAWVEKIDKVQRLPDGQIHVQATFREPVAVVQGPHGYHLVDKKSIRLPGLYLKHQVDQLNMPLITGAARYPQHVGQAWPGEDVAAGLALIELLATQPYRDQVMAYDVSGRDALGRVRLVLHTQTGLVRWGLPPGEEKTIEPPAPEKLSRLARLYQQRGSIDAGGRVVDLYRADIYVHPAGSNRASATPAAYTSRR